MSSCAARSVAGGSRSTPRSAHSRRIVFSRPPRGGRSAPSSRRLRGAPRRKRGCVFRPRPSKPHRQHRQFRRKVRARIDDQRCAVDNPCHGPFVIVRRRARRAQRQRQPAPRRRALIRDAVPARRPCSTPTAIPTARPASSPARPSRRTGPRTARTEPIPSPQTASEPPRHSTSGARNTPLKS